MIEIDITKWLAIWGALTGTIGTITGVVGLVLRYKQHKQDRPILQCDLQCDFLRAGVSLIPNHCLVPRSVGKRPVTVDFVQYYLCLSRTPFLGVVQRHLNWRKGRWIWEDVPQGSLRIESGEKREFPVPEDIEFALLRKIQVVDETGCSWPVPLPKRRKIIKDTRLELLKDLRGEGDIPFHLRAYLAGSEYSILMEWGAYSKSVGPGGRRFVFERKSDYESKLADIVEVQMPQLSKGEINEIS